MLEKLGRLGAVSAHLSPPDHQFQQTEWYPISFMSPKLQQTRHLNAVGDGWHRACHNSATDPCPQAISPGEVFSALGQMKLGTTPGYDFAHQHLRTKALTWLGDFFTGMIWENPKDLRQMTKPWQNLTKMLPQLCDFSICGTLEKHLLTYLHLAASYRPILLLSGWNAAYDTIWHSGFLYKLSKCLPF